MSVENPGLGLLGSVLHKLVPSSKARLLLCTSATLKWTGLSEGTQGTDDSSHNEPAAVDSLQGCRRPSPLYLLV